MATGNNVAAWTDSAGTAVGGSAFSSIDVIEDRNFWPVLRINANGDNILFNRPFDPVNDVTAFIVLATNSAVAEANPGVTHWRAENAIISADVNGGANDFGLTMGGGKFKWWSDNPASRTLVASTGAGYNNQVLTIAGFTRSVTAPNTVNLYANGTLAGTGSQNSSVNLNGNANWGINIHPGSASGGNGNVRVAEVIVFNSVLSAANIRAIETYLAIKHGITLTHDYTDLTASNLYTLGSYGNEVFGIGRLDASSLHQKQGRPAKTIGANDDIALYHGSGFAGTFPTMNAANTNSLVNNTFLITGHNGLASTLTGSYYGAPNTIMPRIYQITDNGSVGTVTLRFDNTTFSGLTSGGNYFLGVSNDATFDNTDTWVAMTEEGTTGDFYVEHDFFNNTTQYFTIRIGGDVGPGGVSAALEGWWRADIGTNGASVTSWNDQSPWGRTISKTSGTVSLIDGGVNFNPYLDLTALAQDFGTGASLNGRTLVVVGRNSSGASTANAGMAGLDGGPGFRFNGTNLIMDGTGGDDWTNGGSGILNANGTTIADGGNTGAMTDWRILIGSKSAASPDLFWVGGFKHATNDPNPNGMDIAEAIVFQSDVNSGVTKQMIESYLAIKYGITLSHATYRKSSGVVVYSDATYINNIAGIARDDRSNLTQKQSSSVNADSVITVGLSGVIAATNALNASTFPADTSFFIWGDNGLDDCWSSLETGGFANKHWRTRREWKFSTAGNIPSIVLRVDSLAGTWVLPALPAGTTAYNLVLDDDGNFNGGALSTYTMTRVVGTAAWEVNLTAADLAGKSYFTIGVQLPSEYVYDNACSSDTILFAGSDLAAGGSCVKLTSTSTATVINLTPGGYTATTYNVIQDNAVGCVDFAQYVNLTIPAEIFAITSFTGGCGVTPADLVSHDTLDISAAVAAGSLEVNGSTEAFLCLGDPNATLTGFGGSLSSIAVAGSSGNFTSLVDSAGFAATGFATLFVHSGNLGHHKVFLFSSGCSLADTVNVYIGNPAPSAVSYAVSSVCALSSVPLLPTVTPVSTPGTYNSSLGLKINPLSGAIRPDSSTAGTYFITFNPSDSTCRTNSIATITISPVDSSEFTYPSTYCINDSNPLPIVTLPFPGSYSILSGAGTGIDAVTGEVLLQGTSGADTCVISFLPSTTCRDTSFSTIILRTPPTLSFSLADSACDPQMLIAATNLLPDTLASQYSWSSPVAGAISFAAPGVIDLVGSSPGGPHPVAASYTDPVTGCTGTAIESITILDVFPLTVTYPSPAFCQGLPPVDPQFTSGPLGGYFFCADTGLVFTDSITGGLDLINSDSGIYQIMYLPPYPSCSISVQAATVTINHTPVADFSMPPTVCRRDSFITMTTVEPGDADHYVFYGIQAGTHLMGNSDNLVNAPNTQMAFSFGASYLLSGNTYLVMRVKTEGICSDTAYDYFHLYPMEYPDFDYIQAEYCQSESDPVPFIHGNGGGVFAPFAGPVIVDDTTGLVDLDSSGSGNFQVIYTTTGPCPESAVDSFSIKPGYKSYFRYVLDDICTKRDTLQLDTNYAPANAPQVFFVESGFPPLQINPTTGLITNMSTMSFPGTVTYTITHITGDADSTCLDTTSREIDITAPDTLFNIEYGVPDFVDTLCGIGSISPVVTGSITGATVTNPAGLIYSNQGTLGEVNLQYSAHDQVYGILMTNNSVCRDASLDSIYIRSRDDARFSYGSTEACSGEGLLIPDTIYFQPGVFTYVPSFSGAVLSLDPNTGVIDMSASTKNSRYVVSYRTLGECRDTSSVTIDINSSPIIGGIQADPGLSFCLSTNVEFECDGLGDVRWFVNGNIESLQRSFTTGTLADGDTVMAILSEPASGCSDSMEVVVQVLPPPLAIIANMDSTISADGPFSFDIQALQDSTVVFWELEGIRVEVGQSGGFTSTLANGAIETVETTAIIEDSINPGWILVYLTPQTFGCRGSRTEDSIRITPGGMPIFIPEVITPNDDLKNDDWKILYSADLVPADYSIQVFNRAGALVHTVSSLAERWTGDNNPDGVYWWILRDNTGAAILSGGLTIRRR